VCLTEVQPRVGGVDDRRLVALVTLHCRTVGHGCC
jgi:hypothetical protein